MSFEFINLARNYSSYQPPKARPDQSFSNHIINMAINLPNIIISFQYIDYLYEFGLNLSKKNTSEIIFKNLFLIILLSHDFGKIAPAFQFRMFRNPKKEIKLSAKHEVYSYHIDLSSIFGYLLTKKYLLSLIDNENIANRISILSLIVIFNHHSRILSNINDIEYKLNDNRDIDFQILEQIREVYDSQYIKDLFKDILLTIKEKSNYFCLNNEYNVLFNELIEIIDMLFSIDNEKYLNEIIYEICDNLNDSIKSNDLKYYFFILFNYSVLCSLDEWDAQAHIKNQEIHLFPISLITNKKEISKDKIDNYIINKYETKEWNSKILDKQILNLRNKTYEITNFAREVIQNKIITLTAPTGSGKTLTLLSLAFKIRDIIFHEKNYNPKILYMLPFISIVDQIAGQVQDIFDLKDLSQSELLIVQHYLSEVDWNFLDKNNEEAEYRGNYKYYFINQWQSNIIISTFVRFWNIIFSGLKRNYIKFFRLNGSIIIFDEIQNIPKKYWKIVNLALKILAHNFNCFIILATATQPLIFEPNEVQEITEKLENYPSLSSTLNRYNLFYDSKEIILSKFLQEILHPYLLKNPDRNTMIILNTKRSAKIVYSALNFSRKIKSAYEIKFLSGYVAPIERFRILEEIKCILNKSQNGKSCLLICTQVIEAGVDVSFDTVFRDIGPIDSIVQVAGRCNRHNKGLKGDVYIQILKDDQGYFSSIYDPISLEITKDLLKNQKSNENLVHNKYFKISETELREKCSKYYFRLEKRVKTDKCLSLLQKLSFTSLQDEFSLIEEHKGLQLLFIKNKKSERILNELHKKLKLNKKLVKIPKNIYIYSLNISNKDFKNIEAFLTPLKLNNSSIYTLDSEKNPDLYDDESGLNPLWDLTLKL